jgi:hypothetical protein
VRKIISILFALSLVLGLSVIATPVSAAVTQPTVVVFDTDCACDLTAGYNITFNITASLTQGVGCVCIKFPAGTTVPPSFTTGDITINGVSIFKEEITVSGTEVCFIPPADVAAGAQVIVTFKTIADIGNPCTPGKYTLEVKTCRAPDSTYVKSAEYTIKPQYTSYKFELDFGTTYPGIAKDFIPPFKACGQNDTDQAFNTTWDPVLGFWWEGFNLTFAVNVTGCAAPCLNVSLWSEVISIPAGEVMNIRAEGQTFNYTSANKTLVVGVYGAEDMSWTGGATLPLVGGLPRTLQVEIHFSSPGTYEFCLYAECPAVGGCDPAASAILAKKCFTAQVYQWKDAAKMVLDEKWNLISLPLVPFNTSITELLKSLDPEALDKDGTADLLSIWHYQWNAGCTAAEWKSWEGPLTTMESGKAYWARLTYPITASPAYNWWVFGTAKNMPPMMPLAYDMCKGWDMFGFTRLAPATVANYLWNFGGAAPELPYPLMYGWYNSGTAATSDWDLIDPLIDSFVVGQGYWGYFPFGGTIVP